MTNCDLEKGLIQRISLLENILYDLYGPQKLLQNEFVPKSFLLSNSLYFYNFTKRHCRKFIYFYTPNIISKDNFYFIQNDNLSEINFSFFRKLSAQTKMKFFKNFSNKDDINSVFFDGSQCIFFENKKEHYSVIHDFYVENENFIIEKDGKKIPINVIFRKLTDNLCDSLELNSCLGIPCLFQLLQSKKIRLVNSIGVQILETPFFQKNMNNLCHFFLKEDLLLPSIHHYYWGKTKEDYEYILEHFDDILLTHIHTNKQVILSIDEFRDTPELYIAQSKEAFNKNKSSKHCVLFYRNKYHIYK